MTVEFLPQTGSPVVKTYNVPAGSRFTIDATFEAPTIQNGSFITLISTAGGVPIVVERSLYWDGAGLTWSGGSSAVATRLPSRPNKARPGCAHPGATRDGGDHWKVVLARSYCRSATAGSTRVARRSGTSSASAAAHSRMTSAAPSAIGSNGGTS